MADQYIEYESESGKKLRLVISASYPEVMEPHISIDLITEDSTSKGFVFSDGIDLTEREFEWIVSEHSKPTPIEYVLRTSDPIVAARQRELILNNTGATIRLTGSDLCDNDDGIDDFELVGICDLPLGLFPQVFSSVNKAINELIDEQFGPWPAGLERNDWFSMSQVVAGD